IKAMTGGDPISARFMRQDFFTFYPVFKLFLAGNNKPSLRNVDDAIRRRMNLVLLDVKITEQEKDKALKEKLKAEWPGILKWMIIGCLEWQRIGLAAPEVVRAATDEYLNAEDTVTQWIAECCDTWPDAFCSTKTLFMSWKAWAELAGEQPRSQKEFEQA